MYPLLNIVFYMEINSANSQLYRWPQHTHT